VVESNYPTDAQQAFELAGIAVQGVFGSAEPGSLLRYTTRSERRA